MMPAFAKMPNTFLQLACGPSQWRRLVLAAAEGGSEMYQDWLRENYFASLAWRRKREERLWLDGGRCACCGTATREVEVRHKTEVRFGDEDVEADLESRCHACHAERELEGQLDNAVKDAAMLRSMKESLNLFTRESEKRAVGRSAIAMLG